MSTKLFQLKTPELAIEPEMESAEAITHSQHRAFDASFGRTICCALCLLLLSTCAFTAIPANAQSPEKFIGSKFNDWGSNNPRPVPEGFGTVFNQLIVAGFWTLRVQRDSVDQYDWSYPDNAYAFAERNNLRRRHHVLWYPKYDGDMNTKGNQRKWLTVENFPEALEIWINLYYQRYGDYIDVMEVINEVGGSGDRNTAFENAIGGAGETGYDWLVHVFSLARNAADKYAPKAKHIINDYSVITSGKKDKIIEMVNVLKSVDPRLIDGIGEQGHRFEGNSAEQIKSGLNEVYKATKLPIYITEYEVDIFNDLAQLDILRAQFPVMYEHPAVPGVTFWGHHEEDMWSKKPNGHLINADGTKRIGYYWLRAYARSKETGPVATLEKVQNHFIALGTESADVYFEVLANDVDGLGNIDVYLNGVLVATETDTQYERDNYGRYGFDLENLSPGNYSLRAVAYDSNGESRTTRESTFKIAVVDEDNPDLIVYAEADAYVKGGSGSSDNSGSAEVLEVKASGSVNRVRESYLRFDLSSIQGRVAAAFLELNVSRIDDDPSAVELKLVADDQWNEKALTFANAPAASESMGVVQGLVVGSLARFNDISEYVNEELKGDRKLTVQLAEYTDGEGVDFHSREFNNQTLRPRLVIHFEPPRYSSLDSFSLMNAFSD